MTGRRRRLASDHQYVAEEADDDVSVEVRLRMRGLA